LDTSENISEIPGSFQTYYWRRIEKISWDDRVRNEEILNRVDGERKILLTIKRRMDNWFGRSHAA